MEFKLNPAQTGNGTMKMYTSCRINLSVDSSKEEGHATPNQILNKEFYIFSSPSPTAQKSE